MAARFQGPLFAPRPTVVGHRGLGGGVVDNCAENTVGSYLAAVAYGLRWVEVDVRRSGDDQLVVHHDPTTPDGKFIIEQPAAAVEGKGVARLAEILDALPGAIGVNVDVKTELEDAVCPPDRRTGALLAPVLARESGRRPLFVSSFDPALLLELRESVPGTPLGLITWVHFPLRHAVPAAAHLGMQAVCLHSGSLGPNPVEHGPVHRPVDYSVRIAHEAGLEVLAWCPDPESALRFADADVDAVCVNDVPGVLEALTQAHS